MLPKRLYYVKVVPGGTRGLRHYEKGGGKYTQKASALQQIAHLARKGIIAELYETQPLEWTKVEALTA